MTTSTTTLTDFLLQRIAEDEEVARAAGAGEHWHAEQDWTRRSTDWTVTTTSTRTLFQCSTEWIHEDGRGIGVAMRSEVEHIARHDPTRVLAECKAKRMIVKIHVEIDEAYTAPRIRCCQNCSAYGEYPGEGWPCATIAALVSVYADHPDFREEWRP